MIIPASLYIIGFLLLFGSSFRSFHIEATRGGAPYETYLTLGVIGCFGGILMLAGVVMGAA